MAQLSVRSSRRALLGALPFVATGLVAAPSSRAAARRPARVREITDRAVDWLSGRTGTGVRVTTATSLHPDRSWERHWTGPMTGRWEAADLPGDLRRRARVRAYATTDSRYLLDERPVDAEGRFEFPESWPGAKSLDVVDPSTGDVLAEWVPSTGLARSYDVAAGDPRWGRTWTYDQALAVLAALVAGDDDRAAEHGRGLMRLQVGGAQDGAFVVNAATIDPEGADHEHRTGSSAWATSALLTWAAALPPGAERDEVLVAAARGSAWLIAQQLRSGTRAGLVTGGRGEWRDGRLVRDVRVTWAATEHAVDCWQAWDLAASTLPDRADRRAAARARDAIEAALVRRLWLPGPGRFLRGYGPDGPDRAHALDNASWGALMLAAAGRRRMAARALEATTRFASTGGGVRGHRPYHRQPAFPRPPELVWVEGTCGVALAEATLGHRARARRTLLRLAPLQRADGAFPYATARHQMTGMDRAPSVAATAWWVLAADGLRPAR